jgi:LmbE family N-acetylglucosaminyl deacetylase
MAVLAHPDDESLGFGGTLARYAAEGVNISLVTATRGERGRHATAAEPPGPEAMGRIREQELRAAAAALGVHDLQLLGYVDQDLDRANPTEVIGRIVAQLRRARPHVVVTFAPDGAYGHPDHIAISQFTTAAIVAAADPAWPGTSALPPTHVSDGDPHRVSKLYYLAWGATRWRAYQSAFKTLVSRVDGVDRQATPWAASSLRRPRQATPTGSTCCA